MERLVGKQFSQATIFEPGFAMGYRQSEVKDLTFRVGPDVWRGRHFVAQFVFRGKRKQQSEAAEQWVIIKGWDHPWLQPYTEERSSTGYRVLSPMHSLISPEWDTLLDNHLSSLSPPADIVFDGRADGHSMYSPRRRGAVAMNASEPPLPSTSIKYPDEVPTGSSLWEGLTTQILVNKYERNPIARQRCLAYHGYACQACGTDMQTVYGALGKDYIHVHHRVPMAEIGEDYEVDPINDLVPVCPNCHAMLHRGETVLAVEQLRQIIENHTGTRS